MPRSLFIAGFLLFQSLLPLRYYLAGDTRDERFCWRMFSSVRMRDHTASVTETRLRDGKPVEQQAAIGLPSDWVLLINRVQGSLVDRYLQWRIGRPDLLAVSYEIKGKTTDGKPLAPRRWSIDRATGQIQFNEAMPP